MFSNIYNMKYKSSQDGFTLIEMMITVAIIGILAAIALPSYQDYVRKGKAAEATSTLAGLRVQMEQYFQDYRTYEDVDGKTAPCAPPTNSAKYFTYSCSSQKPTTYTITAAGVAGQGMGNFSFTIDQNNGKTSNFDGTTGGTCWLTTKNGTC